ncbi:hypothetical protein [Acinetobacter dispersus]|uniref:hypothetical protein n=1 Tax=Acinetobacter dispersus TaxID=70348 RepID=UPI001F4B56AA|nr:hypothetical protein [Acinetobacter dispersus]MCH7391842.1 hypothetical protein [Acinetobacter dispersus]
MNKKQEVTEFDLRRPEFQSHELTPDMFEFDKDGNVVRKDRFEKGMRRILGVLIEHGLASSRDSWTVDEVVEKVKKQFATMFEEQSQ